MQMQIHEHGRTGERLTPSQARLLGWQHCTAASLGSPCAAVLLRLAAGRKPGEERKSTCKWVNAAAVNPCIRWGNHMRTGYPCSGGATQRATGIFHSPPVVSGFQQPSIPTPCSTETAIRARPAGRAGTSLPPLFPGPPAPAPAVEVTVAAAACPTPLPPMDGTEAPGLGTCLVRRSRR